MYIFGKLIGSIFGFLLIGNILGVVLGLYLGHLFDKGLKQNLLPFLGRPARGGIGQKQFFKTTFLIMGYLAKLDGRVSEREINVARLVMDRLSLDADQKREAIEYFTQGKEQDFDFKETLSSFAHQCRHQPQISELFLDLQVQGAMADGRMIGSKRQVLIQICSALRIPNSILYNLETQYHKQSGQDSTTGSSRGHQYAASPVSELAESYKILGVDRTATDVQIKKAYRKLVSQNHPDKLVSKGLPPEMIKLATEKTQKIHKAYEIVQQARGMK
ncbi:MAG: co-chaperone DjlA [Gammaproteobacteria bacterium]